MIENSTFRTAVRTGGNVLTSCVFPGLSAETVKTAKKMRSAFFVCFEFYLSVLFLVLSESLNR